MSFLKYIMRPFVEFNEEKEPGAANETGSTQVENNTTVPGAHKAPSVLTPADPPSYKPSATAATSTSSLVEHQNHFDQLVEEANAKNPLFQGTDFKEFIDSKVDVEGIADEESRYKTAFNVLKRTGLTKDRLIKTGQQYISLIAGDIQGFEGAYLQQYKKDVEEKEQALLKKNGELQALNERISALNQEIKQISQDIIQNKQQLNSNKNSFVSAGETKIREIESELQKIGQYFI